MKAIRHRVEVYRLPPFLWRFPVPVYEIETTEGRAVFGGRYGLQLDEALRNVSAMAHVPITDEGEVDAGIGHRSLLRPPVALNGRVRARAAGMRLNRPAPAAIQCASRAAVRLPQ